MTRGILWAAVAAGTVAFLAMLTATAVFAEAVLFSGEVKQDGTSFYLTPAQKRTLDRIASGTPIVWFGALGVAVAAILVGAAARLWMPFGPPSSQRAEPK